MYHSERKITDKPGFVLDFSPPGQNFPVSINRFSVLRYTSPWGQIPKLQPLNLLVLIRTPLAGRRNDES